MKDPVRAVRPRRGGTVTAVLVLTALSLMSLDLRTAGDSPLDGARSVVSGALGPVEAGFAAATAPLRGSPPESDERVVALQAQVDRLTAELERTDLERSRVAQLDALLRLTGAGQYATVPALVVAVGPSQLSERSVTIDVGTTDGVAVDMTVVNGDGLVGRVAAVTSTTSTVQLVVDGRTQLAARLEASSELGIARGNGVSLELELLDALAPMSTGDQVVTFGSPSGTPWVADIPVGELSVVRGDVGAPTRRAVLTPYVDFSRLDLVGVVVAHPRTDPRDAVPPPAPTAPAS